MHSDELNHRLEHCDLCPRHCGVNRVCGESGFCRVLKTPKIYQHFLHFGEEEMIAPAFIVNFAGCNLSCPDCPEREHWQQPGLPITNATVYAHALISHWNRAGLPASLEWIGGEPSLNLPFILEASCVLKQNLSNCPPIYINTNAYFNENLISYMQDVIDGFVFDLKCSRGCSKQITGAEDYYDVVTRNIQLIEKFGWNPDSLIVRHLVVPHHIDCCTKPVIEWFCYYTPELIFNLMTTYRSIKDSLYQGLDENSKKLVIEYTRCAGVKHLLINGVYE